MNDNRATVFLAAIGFWSDPLLEKLCLQSAQKDAEDGSASWLSGKSTSEFLIPVRACYRPFGRLDAINLKDKKPASDATYGDLGLSP
jgi:hypothetical protein